MPKIIEKTGYIFQIILFSGFCCIQYRICDASGSFSLDTNGPQDTGSSKIETGCTGDFIQIEGKMTDFGKKRY